jgi:hypothetical protein
MMLLWLLIAVVPVDEALRDHVDLIEINHVYNDLGQPVFDQLIFWEWCSAAARWQVRAWRMAKGAGIDRAVPLPERDWQRGGYVLLWRDGDRLRIVRAAAVRETWTQYDPEMVEREVWPVDRRRGLRMGHGERPSQGAVHDTPGRAAAGGQ